MNTFDIIREMVADKKGIDINLITMESTFDELNIDSLDMFDLIFEAEDKLGVVIPNGHITITNIEGVVNLIDGVKND